MPPKRKKKIKDSVIPPLDFVGSMPSEGIPINDEYIPCTANFPRVRTIASENQPWIEPHFDYSGFSRQPSQTTRAFKLDDPPSLKRKTKSKIGPLNFSSEGTPRAIKSRRSLKTRVTCPLFPLVTPKPPRRNARILVPESPER